MNILEGDAGDHNGYMLFNLQLQQNVYRRLNTSPQTTLGLMRRRTSKSHRQASETLFLLRQHEKHQEGKSEESSTVGLLTPY